MASQKIPTGNIYTHCFTRYGVVCGLLGCRAILLHLPEPVYRRHSDPLPFLYTEHIDVHTHTHTHARDSTGVYTSVSRLGLFGGLLSRSPNFLFLPLSLLLHRHTKSLGDSVCVTTTYIAHGVHTKSW